MTDLFSINEKYILVTGASSGIGREIAVRCAESGARLVITGRDQARLEETRQLMSGEGHTAIACDLAEEQNIQELVKQMPELNGAVFCAGVIEYNPVRFVNGNKIRNTFAVNFDSQVLLTQQLVKQKKVKNGSSLVYVSSIASQLGVAGTAMYAASKASLNAFVRVTASELAPQKIRANSICPGIVVTPMGEHAQDMSADLAKDYPLGLGQPVDVAAPCIFFLSEASRWITGTELVMDGGLTLK